MENNDIPMNADHWLFAEDFVNFIFRRHENFPIDPIAEECREFVREGFTETVRSAVAVLENNMRAEVDAVFAEMSLKADVVEEYKAYTSDLRNKCGSSGFDGNKFLNYCVHVTCLGERFHRAGLEDFHYLAFTSVREALKRYDMITGGWDTLQMVAVKITSVEEQFQNLPSPEYRSPDYELNILNENPVNRTLILLNEKCGSSIESTSRQNSSEGTTDSDGSMKSIDGEQYEEDCLKVAMPAEFDSECDYSEKSSPKHIISTNSISSKSNTSSSTESEQLRNVSDNSSQEEGNGSDDWSSNMLNHSTEEKSIFQ